MWAAFSFFFATHINKKKQLLTLYFQVMHSGKRLFKTAI